MLSTGRKDKNAAASIRERWSKPGNTGFLPKILIFRMASSQRREESIGNEAQDRRAEILGVAGGREFLLVSIMLAEQKNQQLESVLLIFHRRHF